MSLATAYANLKQLLSQMPILSRDRMALAEQMNFYTDVGTRTGLTDLWEVVPICIQDMRLPAAGYPAFTKFADNGSGSTGVFAYVCSKTAVNSVFFTVQPPHNYKEGSAIEVNFHWAQPSNDPGTPDHYFVLGCEYAWVNINAAPTTTTVLTETVTALQADAVNVQKVTTFDSITGTGKTMANQLWCRIYRDGADVGDDYDDTLWLLGASVSFQIDKLGSTAQWTK